MSKHIPSLIAFFTLLAATLACSLPIPAAGQPTQSNETAVSPSTPDPNQVGTVVAQTLAALAPTASPTAPTPIPTWDESKSLLPHTLYFLGNSGGHLQVFRMEQDGKTQHQITSEEVDVTDYDVSPMDGSIAYVVKNNIVYANADGSGRDVLVYGGPVDPNNPFSNTISNPVFSRDGQILAYGYKGLRFYSFVANKSQLIIANQVDTLSNGLMVPKELYWPERYSPDGSKLLITLGYYESASSAVYDPSTGALVRLDGGEGGVLCCDDVKWSADSASIYAASPTLGMFPPGLWRIDAATGKVTTLIAPEAGGGNYNLPDEAYLAPDGQLYFFFATAPISQPEGAITRSSLQLYRSAPDGVTGRTLLSKEDFRLLNEALWAPDATFVIVALAPIQDVYEGGEADIVYLDGRPRIVLAQFAQQLKWGP